MPNPAVALVGGSLGSAIIGARGASKAATAQSDAADKQLGVQKEMFDRMDTLQRGLYRGQSGDIRDIYGENIGQAADERNALQDLFDRQYAGDKWHLANFRDQGRHRLDETMDQGLSINREAERRGVEALRWGRREAIDRLNPWINQGQNATGALAYNMGLRSKPGNYTGLEASPEAKFLLNEGRTEIEGGAAGAGGLYSGETLKALEDRRFGLMAGDRTNQMDELFRLSGMGQDAATTAGGWNQDTAAKIAALRQTAGDNAIGLRQWGATGKNAITGAYTDALLQARNNYYGGLRGAETGYTDRMAGLGQNYISNLGNARGQRANLFGTAATNYANGASTAYGNAGDARAAGAVGGANAMTGAISNGLMLSTLMGGLGGQSTTGGGLQGGTNFLSNWFK